jgi:hypothetical protein
MASPNTRRPTTQGPEKSGYRRVVFSLTGLAALAWLALWLGRFFSTPKEVLEMRAWVDAEVVKLDQMARNEVPFSSDRSSMGEVFGRMRDMPEGVRDQVREEVGRLFRARERAANAATNGGQRQGRQPGQGGPPAPAGGQRPGKGGPPGQRGSRTDEQIQAWRKARLDRSSPEERARSAEYRRAMTVRREQLGISPGRGRGA